MDIFIEIKEVAEFLFHKGWAERNAGNFSYRLNDALFCKNCQLSIVDCNCSIRHFKYKIELDIDLDGLNIPTDIEPILISVSNSKFRDIAKDPASNCGIVFFENDSSGAVPSSKYSNTDFQSPNKLMFLCSNESQKPTSELYSHLMIHKYLAATFPNKRAVLHTHPTYLLAFSHKHYHRSKLELNKLLESMIPEVEYYIPRRTGFVDLMVPGSKELAYETINQLSDHDTVVWKKHGCLGVSETLWDAVDMIDILDKAAHIALYVN